jgi:hypothetical protein
VFRNLLSLSTYTDYEELRRHLPHTIQTYSSLIQDVDLLSEPCIIPTTHRVVRRPVVSEEQMPLEEINRWFRGSGIPLGHLVPDPYSEEVMRTFYTYRDLAAKSITNIPSTALLVYRVRI